MNTVDLHTHSIYSDGTYTPEEIVRLAAEKGLAAVALTDHDTLEGVEEALHYGRVYNVQVIPGIEVSTEFEGTEIHIVGLFAGNDNKEFNDALEKLRESRINRNAEMVKRLNEIGVPVEYENVLKYAKGNVVSRAHIAKEIANIGYANSINDAFNKFVGKDKPAYVKRKVMSRRDTLRLIAESGGIAVLAHPLLYKLESSDLEKMVGELARCGLRGIEAYYSTHSEKDTEYIKSVAERFDLKLSGGSDFHGENKPNIELGTGLGSLRVPYKVLEDLESEVKQRGVQNA